MPLLTGSNQSLAPIRIDRDNLAGEPVTMIATLSSVSQCEAYEGGAFFDRSKSTL